MMLSKQLPLVAAALLAIGGGATAASAQSSAAGASKIFLSNGLTVEVFAIDNQSPAGPIGTISSPGAAGLTIDPSGRLLVARESYGDVAIYDTRTFRQVGRLQDRGQLPSSIAVGADGTTYVGNVFSARSGPGSVSVYEHGSRQPTKTLTCPSFYMVNGVAVDAHGDVFVNQNRTSSGSPEVDMFPAGSRKCHALPIGEYYAAGAAVDPNTGNLLLADQGARSILIVAPPYTSVTQEITLPECIGEQVFDLALDPTTSLLYISDPENGADVLSYPGGGRMATYSMSSAKGIAIAR